MNLIVRPFLVGALAWCSASLGWAQAQPSNAPEGWTATSPRDEIRPAFAFHPARGSNHGGIFTISSDARPGLHGRWEKSFPVTSGRWYKFRALRRTHDVPAPQRSAHVEIRWSDAQGERVLRKVAPGEKRYALETFTKPDSRFPLIARPEFPREGATSADGWTELSCTFSAPEQAAHATVELHLRWAAGGTVEWSEISLTETSVPSRKVRLATVQLQGRGRKATTALEACRLYEPAIENAAQQRADIVCLTEILTAHFSGLTYAQAAEPIPGPSTAYFGELATQHDLYIAAGLVERDGHLIYNTTALVGPDGTLVGKYRKVCVTAEEGNEGGIAPGDGFPVFETRFGKVGIMICWDLQFPEPARMLRDQGAEIILLPIAGGNPALASARAIENQVYLVSSVWGGKSRKDWIKTGIYDYDGKLLATAERGGAEVAVAEVDLDAPKYWANLGDLKGHIDRLRPAPQANAGATH